MAACALKEIFRQGQAGLFRCWTRCVRRAFLMGDDPLNGKRASDKGLLDLTLTDYARLLDYAGREIKADKVGAIPADLIPADLASIVERLGLVSGERFVAAVKNFPRLFRRVADRAAAMKDRAQPVGRQWMQGVRAAAAVFAATPPPLP